MVAFIRFLIGCLALAPVASAIAASADALESDRRVAAVFSDYDGTDQPGCVVGVAQSGKLVHASAHGMANLATGGALGADSIFNLASVSKQFTAFALLLLEERGRLSLDDPVTRYLPELAPSARGVTLRHLLHHVGGLRDYTALLEFRGRKISEGATSYETLMALARQEAAENPPGVVFDYSNTGYFLIAAVIERVSGQTLAQFSDENIFRPLGMSNTRIIDRYPARIAQLARGYEKSADGFVLDESAWEQTGDGQVHSNLRDLALWDENFYSATVGGRAVVERMLQTGALDSGERLTYAAGLQIGEMRGLSTVSHGGSWAGYRSQLIRFPTKHFTVAVLCNRGDVATSSLASAVAEIYLSEQMREQVAMPAGREELDVLPNAIAPERMPAGAYRDARNGSHLFLSSNGGVTRLSAFGVDVVPKPAGAHAYALEGWSNMYVAFQHGVGAPPRIVMRSRDERYVFDLVPTWEPGDLSRFAGAYFGAEANTRCVLVAEKAALNLEGCGEGKRLIPGAPGEFASLDGLFSLRFPLSDAPIRNFEYVGFSLRGLRFERLPEPAP